MAERTDRYAVNIEVEDLETSEYLVNRWFHADNPHLVKRELRKALEDMEEAEE